MNKKVPFIFLLGIAVLFIFLIVGFYFYHFHSYSVSPDPEDWGPFGDFFGGILNPVLAFFSFMALLYTLYIQQEELRLTRDELKNSAKAQKETAEFTRNQSLTSKAQLESLKDTEKKNDIYLLIKSIAEKIEVKLSEKTKTVSGSSEAPLILSIKFICNNYDKCIESKEIVIKRIGQELQFLKNELGELERLLYDFDNLARHDYLSNYYNSIFSDVRAAIRLIDER